LRAICADVSDELRQGCCIDGGLQVIRDLYKPATAARLADGIVAFAGSGD